MAAANHGRRLPPTTTPSTMLPAAITRASVLVSPRHRSRCLLNHPPPTQPTHHPRYILLVLAILSGIYLAYFRHDKSAEAKQLKQKMKGAKKGCC